MTETWRPGGRRHATTSKRGDNGTGRRARIPRHELARQLLEAGVSLLREQGTANVAAEVTFQRVYQRLAASGGPTVANASVIGRIWDDLADFQRDVVTAIALEDSPVEYDATLDAILPVLLGADTTTLAGRRAAMDETVRVGAEANLRQLSGSRDWRLVVGIWSMAATQGPAAVPAAPPSSSSAPSATSGGSAASAASAPSPAGERDLLSALAAGYASSTTSAELLYTLVLRTLGWRMLPHTSLRQLAIAASCLAEGFALRALVDPDATAPLPTDGVAWTPFARALRALVLDHCEPSMEIDAEPVDDVIADLSTQLDP